MTFFPVPHSPSFVRPGFHPVGTWHNGYAFRATVAVDAGMVSETAADAIGLFKIDASGRLESLDAADFRIEDDARSPLPYRLVDYVNGVLFLAVRLPQLSSSVPSYIHFFAGKEGEPSEQNIAGVYAGYLQVIDCITGLDLTEHGYDGVLSGVTAGSLGNGWPCGVFGGANEIASTASSGWIAGHDALAIHAIVDSDVAAAGVTAAIYRNGAGPAPTQDGDNAVLARWGLTSYGAADPWLMKVETTGGNTYRFSAAELAVTGQQVVASDWRFDAENRIFLDGVEVIYGAGTSVFGVSTQNTDGWAIGVDYVGKIAEVRVRAAALQPAAAFIEGKIFAAPMSVYGQGAWHKIAEEAPIIAMPVRADATAGVAIDIDVTGAAIGPGTLQSVTQGVRGSVSIEGGLARYTATGTEAGADFFTFTLSDTPNESVGRCDVTIAASGGGGGGGGGTGTALPSPLTTINVSNQTQFAAALAAANPGDRILLANGSYQIGTFSRSGTEANPIQIVAANLLGALITTNTVIDGDDVILYGLDHSVVITEIGKNTQAQRVKIWRCRWRDRAVTSIVIAFRAYNSPSLDVAYCTFANWAGRGIALGVANGAVNCSVRRCAFLPAPNQRDNSGAQFNATEALQVGFGDADAPISANALIEENYIEGWVSDDETISIKSSGNTIRRNTLKSCGGNITNRVGNGNKYEGNTLRDSPAPWNFGKNDWGGNLCIGTALPYGSLQWQFFVGNSEYNDFTGSWSGGDNNRYNRSFQSRLAGNTALGALFIGHNPSWVTANFDANQTRVRQHSGTITLGTQSGTDSVPGDAEGTWTWAAASELTAADCGHGAAL